MKEFLISIGEGLYEIKAVGRPVGGDLIVSISGGTKPHIGAVAIGLPRPSLREPSVISSTSSVFTLVGHKEDTIAKRASERLAAGLNTVVVVTVGIHIDEISEEGIQKMVQTCDEVINSILEILLNT